MGSKEWKLCHSGSDSFEATPIAKEFPLSGREDVRALGILNGINGPDFGR